MRLCDVMEVSDDATMQIDDVRLPRDDAVDEVSVTCLVPPFPIERRA